MSKKFREGFLKAAAERGYSCSDLEVLLNKNTKHEKVSALNWLVSPSGILTGTRKLLFDYPIAMGLLGGGMAGAGLAYGRHALFDSEDPQEIEKFKNEKKIRELRFQIDNLKRKNESRK